MLLQDSVTEYMVKSHKMDSFWGPVRNSGGHIITLLFLFKVLSATVGGDVRNSGGEGMSATGGDVHDSGGNVHDSGGN